MPSDLPERVGPYQVVREIGRGGMGVVYLARDTKLDRDVAIKALPAELAEEPERLARFEREAKLLASMHHSNIAGVYGLEEERGVRYLILECVEGETLDALIKRGPLPVDDALSIARQIAEAVEAAHDKGIIHRDLKPANIKIAPDGEVKVLDFGLAKALQDQPSSSNVADSPTVVAGQSPTMPGIILGTAGYMSPEQARGKPLDKRTDIWSFGCVLYEMLTGQQVFPGETVTDSLGAILHKEPAWDALPGDTPPTVHLLLRRCLAKDRRRRLQDIGDARVELDEAIADPTSSSLSIAAAAIQQRGAPTTKRLAVAMLGLLLVISIATNVITFSRSSNRPAPPPAARLVIPLPDDATIPPLLSRPVAISPDGSRVVFAVGNTASDAQLYVRSMDQLEAAPIPGTEGGVDPFFSPDGRWVGFMDYRNLTLMKVRLTGGAPVTISSTRTPVGAVWGPDDTIFFSDFDPRQRPASSVIVRVSAGGGDPEPVTTSNPEAGDRYHWFPEVLPGGKALLFSTTAGLFTNTGNARLVVQSLETGERKTLLEGVVLARYSPTGHLVFARDGTVMAVPFDLDHLELTGPEAVLFQGVRMNANGAPNFAFSDTGSLVYVRGNTLFEQRRSLQWVNRQGMDEPLAAGVGPYFVPRLSPDGTRLVVSRFATGGDSGWDVRMFDLVRNTVSRLTFGESDSAPIWAPDGQRVAFRSGTRQDGVSDLYWTPADGSGEAELLLESDTSTTPDSFSPDGSTLAFTKFDPETLSDIWMLPIEGERKAEPFLQTAFEEYGAAFSLDGRWVAYVCDESGHDEVYVRPYPQPSGKWQVSTSGGTSPAWSRDGTQLYYRSGDAMMAVEVTTEPTFSASVPRMLFEGPYEEFGLAIAPRNYDVAPDGERFVMVRNLDESAEATQIHVVLNWFEELKERAPAGKD